jgi:Cu+-exporting ATPase
MITGESMPVVKVAGAKLIGGTMNGTGSFVMRAERVGRDTMLAQIVEMVGQAQRSRAPIQRLVDQASGWFVPLVIAIALRRSRPGRSGGRSRDLPTGLWRPSRY